MDSADKILEEIGGNEPFESFLEELKDEKSLTKKVQSKYEKRRDAPFMGSKIRCTKCGKVIDYDTCHKVEEEIGIGEEEKTISGGFPTGVTVKQSTRKYRVVEQYLCDDCYKQYVDDKKKRKIKKGILYLLGVLAVAIIILLVANKVIAEEWLFIAAIPVFAAIARLLNK